MTDDIADRLDGPSTVKDHFSAIHILVKDAREGAKEIRRLRERIAELAAERERLAGCLAVANANHERFEREWYLAEDRAEAAEAENARLRDALTPSGETKAAYIGEIECDCPHETYRHRVPWTSTKAIMAMIRARAALGEAKA